LLIRPGAIGDCLLTFPAMEAARADFTEVWVPSAVVPLVQFADRVRAISRSGLELLGIPGASDSQVRETLAEFDSVYSWYGTKRPEFREAVRGLPFEFFPALPIGSEEHAADFFARHTGASRPAVPRLSFDAAADGAEIVIHPFSGSAKKNWPLADFYRVASVLEERFAWRTAWCVGPEQEVPGSLPALRCDSLDDVARHLRAAQVYIGNDSGITHLAAACGVPVVAIFLATDPAVWAPRGELIEIVKRSDGSSIQPDEVVGAVERLLERARLQERGSRRRPPAE
jgi:ADP-heptose:LPS heptosyltransferase